MKHLKIISKKAISTVAMAMTLVVPLFAAATQRSCTEASRAE